MNDRAINPMYYHDNYDKFPEHLKEKYWELAVKLIKEKKPVTEMRPYELDAVMWYEACWIDLWSEGEGAQTVNEYVMELDAIINLYECQTEVINRKLKWLKETRDEQNAIINANKKEKGN